MAVDALRHERVVELIEDFGDEVIFTNDFFRATGLDDYNVLVEADVFQGMNPDIVAQLSVLNDLTLSITTGRPFYVEGLVYPQSDQWRFLTDGTSHKTYIDAHELMDVFTVATFVGYEVRRRIPGQPLSVQDTFPPDAYLAQTFISLGGAESDKKQREITFGIPLINREAHLELVAA